MVSALSEAALVRLEAEERELVDFVLEDFRACQGAFAGVGVAVVRVLAAELTGVELVEVGDALEDLRSALARAIAALEPLAAAS